MVRNGVKFDLDRQCDMPYRVTVALGWIVAQVVEGSKVIAFCKFTAQMFHVIACHILNLTP